MGLVTFVFRERALSFFVSIFKKHFLNLKYDLSEFLMTKKAISDGSRCFE